jgi:hypothetical protein
MPGTGRALDHLEHAGHQRVDVGGPGRERLAPREGQQAVRQRGRAPGRAQRHAHVALDLVQAVLVDAHVHQFQAARDPRQQVVEIVRQAAGELADGLHLLRLAQLLLGALQLVLAFAFGGDVARRAIQLAVGGHRHPRQPAPAAVLVAQAVFQAQRRQVARQRILPGLAAGGAVVGVDEIQEGGGGDFVLAPAQGDAPGRVRGFEAALGIQHAEDVGAELPGAAARHRLGHDLLFEFVVEGAQLDDRVVALGLDRAARFDVDQHAGEAESLAVRAEVDAAVGLDPVVAAVRALDAVLVRIVAAARDHLADGGGQAGLVVGMDGGHHLGQAQADAAQRRIQAEGARKAFVDGEAVARQIPEPGADDGAGAQRQLHAVGILVRARFALVALAQRQHGFRGLDAVAQQAEDAAFVVADRTVGVAEPGFFAVALALHGERQVFHAVGFAMDQGTFAQRRQHVADLGPDFEEGLTEGARVLVVQQCGVGVVVEQDLFRSPDDEAGEGRGEHHVDAGAQVGRPGGERAEGRGGPVAVADCGSHPVRSGREYGWLVHALL